MPQVSVPSTGFWGIGEKVQPVQRMCKAMVVEMCMIVMFPRLTDFHLCLAFVEHDSWVGHCYIEKSSCTISDKLFLLVLTKSTEYIKRIMSQNVYTYCPACTIVILKSISTCSTRAAEKAASEYHKMASQFMNPLYTNMWPAGAYAAIPGIHKCLDNSNTREW